MTMVTLTLREGNVNQVIDVAVNHIVMVQSANPSGSLITMTRGMVHVAQTREQVCTACKLITGQRT